MNQTCSGESFWTAKQTAPHQYPWLDHEEPCDVAVVGAGITGAFCALRFAQAGLRTVLLGGGPVGQGCSKGSTGLAQPGVCDGLLNLSRKAGMDHAVRMIRLLAQSINNLESLSGELEPFDFSRRDHFYYQSGCASDEMRQEYLAQKHNGLDVDFVDTALSMQDFSFAVDSGIYMPNGAAQMNPYLLCHALVKKAADSGALVYENAPVEKTCEEKNQSVLHCAGGGRVRAKHVVFSLGPDNVKHMDCGDAVRTAFTLVTAPVESFSGWKNQCVIARQDRSPVYLRVTPDNRIMISGLETGLLPAQHRLAGRPPVSRMISHRYDALLTLLREMFPGVRNLMPEYAYCNRFAKTDNGLPVMWADENGHWFASCPGINGIPYAETLSRMLVDRINDQPNQDMPLFVRERETAAVR